MWWLLPSENDSIHRNTQVHSTDFLIKNNHCFHRFRGVPKILNAPVSSIALKENESLYLLCSVDTNGDPDTRIEWIRERDKATVGQGETFQLNNIKQTDAGRYYCKAQNNDRCGCDGTDRCKRSL